MGKDKTATIDATLKLNEKNEEIIAFSFGGKLFNLDFVSENQTYLRDMFKNILEYVYDCEELKMNYSVDENVKNETIKKVSENYISDLEKEILNCITEIKKSREE